MCVVKQLIGTRARTAAVPGAVWDSDARYGKGGNFDYSIFQDDGAPYPQIVGMPFVYCNINVLGYLGHESVDRVAVSVYSKVSLWVR